MKHVTAVAAILIALCGMACAQMQGEQVTVIANPGFEQGMEGWGFWPDESGSKAVIDTEVSYEGNASVRVDAVSPADRAFVLSSSKDFEHGVLYRVSVAIRHDDSVPETQIGFVTNYRDGETGAIISRADPMGLAKTDEDENGWKVWSGLFIADEKAGSWQLLLRVEYAAGRTWFDDIRFESLGPVGELKPNVWEYMPVGVEIGGPPASRFTKHMQDNDAAYQMAARYNDLLMQSCLAEAALRAHERCLAYAGKQPDASLRGLFATSEERLNQTYTAFAAAFKSADAADQQAFSAAAEALRSAVAALRDAVSAADVDLRASNQVTLPEHLGEQPRDVPVFGEAGRMNRLLIGVWSPTNWREFEKPFGFEFHSAGPGVAREYTETGIDISNVTALCDQLEQSGYAGTFAMMPFGQHDVIWAPQWLMEKHADDPDIRKVSADGCQGRDTTYYGLNYHHPAVKQHIRDYLKAYCTAVKDEDRIYFYETSQEALPYFACEKGRRETGYGPSATADFHAWLAEQYRDIGTLNAAWGTTYDAFSAIEQPPDRYATPGRDITPLVAEFERFREDSYIDYLKLIYDSIKSGDPSKPVASRHSSLLTAINGARIYETCDVLGFHTRAPRMQVMNCYLNSLSRYNNRDLAYLEDFWGCQQESDRVYEERAQRRGLEKHVCRTFAWGRTLQMKWYAYTTGSYLFNYNGNWFDPRYDVLTMRYCAPALKVALDRMRNVDWLLTHSEIPRFRVCIWQPSASMRVQGREGLSAGEIIGLHGLIYPEGFFYELVPEEYFADGKAKLSDFDVVFLPCAEYLSEEHQVRLTDYVREGGTLIALEPPGVRDELARPSGRLMHELFGIDNTEFDATAAVWSLDTSGLEPVPDCGLFAKDVGDGQAFIAPTTLARAAAGRDARQALLGILREKVLRLAWSENAAFEVLPRLAENGERYLFVLNPDPDEVRSDRVSTTWPMTEPVDISVPGGFHIPVTADNSVVNSIPMTLGPGEMAVVWVK